METKVALAGVAGSLLGAMAGALGATRAALISSRGQSSLEAKKSLKTAVNAFATAMLLQRDAVDEIMGDVRWRRLEPVAVMGKIQAARQSQVDLKRTVSAVAVEAPEYPAALAQFAVVHLDIWLEHLADFISEGMPPAENPDQVDFWEQRWGDKRLMDEVVDSFTRACRAVFKSERRMFLVRLLPPARRRRT
ncbi:hypothetical protein OG905_00250 [Streptomyces sp. NBC_00322]|uniref:hypothetical protein n=1 Tax=Streptomyces sp. NBC_00322 TaxID=2975712 RepID=UPI002E2CA89E|nr:hypothetical protein [Streptomyces sp. NBC_00322]